jgi:superfamily II DNA or RNA helicase
MLELRPYQERALENIEQAEREGVRRPLVVHPTGTGKTVVMSTAVDRRKDRGRSILMVHRDELADQTIEKLGWQAPELSTGLVKAGSNEVGADLLVVSVATGSRPNRLEQILASQEKYGSFGTIICDEAHHAPAPSWTRMLTGLGAFNPYGPLAVGFTATPERDNGKTLGVWEKVVDYMSIREAIFQGHLVPILPAVVIETKMDMGHVGKGRDGDLSGGDLGRELEDSGAIDQMADAVVQHAADRKGVAFLPTIRTSELLADALRQRGIRAEHVDGNTETSERKAILKRLKTGETQWVTNCAVLTEGFDEPTIDCVLVGRPTKFHGLYVQMVGRGTRKALGKDNLLVLDVVGASQRHELIGVVDLGLDLDDERKKPEEPSERQACPTCEEPCEVERHRCALCQRYLPARIVSEGETRHDNCRARSGGIIDVFGSSRLTWLPVGPGWVLGAGKEVVVMAPAGPDTWRLASYEGGRVKVLHDMIPSEWAMGIGEDRAKAFQKLAERTARWRNQPVTQLQQGRLLREGLPEGALSRVKTSGEAADLVTRIQGRRAMKKLGVAV